MKNPISSQPSRLFTLRHSSAVLLVLLLASPAKAFEAYEWFYMPTSSITLDYAVWLPGEVEGQTYQDLFIRAGEAWVAQSAADIRMSFMIEQRPLCFQDPGGQPYPNNNDGVNWYPAGDFCGYPDIFSPLGLALIGAPVIAFLSPGTSHLEDWTWTADSFSVVALHEIGHNLGLGHSAVHGAVMASGNAIEEDLVLTPDDLCGIAALYGPWSDCPLRLAPGLSTSGAPTAARFAGGASHDLGKTFKTTFHPVWETVYLHGTWIVDPAHRDLAGQLHVVVVNQDGDIFGLAADDRWSRERQIIPLDPANPFPLPALQTFPEGDGFFLASDFPIQREPYRSIHSAGCDYAPDRPQVSHANTYCLLAGDHGPEYTPGPRTLDFFLGYSVDSIPNEIFYSPTPIRVEWQLEEWGSYQGC